MQRVYFIFFFLCIRYSVYAKTCSSVLVGLTAHTDKMKTWRHIIHFSCQNVNAMWRRWREWVASCRKTNIKNWVGCAAVECIVKRTHVFLRFFFLFLLLRLTAVIELYSWMLSRSIICIRHCACARRFCFFFVLFLSLPFHIWEMGVVGKLYRVHCTITTSYECFHFAYMIFFLFYMWIHICNEIVCNTRCKMCVLYFVSFVSYLLHLVSSCDDSSSVRLLVSSEQKKGSAALGNTQFYIRFICVVLNFSLGTHIAQYWSIDANVHSNSEHKKMYVKQYHQIDEHIPVDNIGLGLIYCRSLPQPHINNIHNII